MILSRVGYQNLPNDESGTLQDVLAQEKVWGFAQVIAVVLLVFPLVAFYGKGETASMTTLDCS